MRILTLPSVKALLVVGTAAWLLLSVGNASAAVGGGWQNHISIYGWLAGLDGTAKYPIENQPDVEVDASDILEDLEMVFMGTYEGRYDRWSLIIDTVYLDLGDSGTTETRFGSTSVGLDISSWVVHGGVGYDLVHTDRALFGVVGGVRYLSLDAEIDAEIAGTPGQSRSDNESLTDGIIGIRGQFSINEHWFLPYYADIGAGGSDLSTQLFAAIGYRYKWFDVKLGYRFLYFDLGDDRFMEDLQISGPVLGVGFKF
jgi:hypothetical protein